MDKQTFIGKFSSSLQSSGFSEPIEFSNVVGFSTSKERLQSGHPFVSIYKFYFKNEDLENGKEKKPIIVSVSYAEKLKDGTLQISPTSIKRRINWPIDLLSTDEFFYDSTTGELYFKNKKIGPRDLIQKIESLHIKPTKLLRGFVLIMKLFFWKILVTNFFKFLYYLLIEILYLISGTKTSEGIWSIKINQNQIKENENIEKESFAKEEIDIFGYKASAWAVTVYAILHISIYSYYFHCDLENDFVKSIFSNTFLTITYVIPSLVFFERLIPEIIRLLIMSSGKFFHKTLFKQIKI